MKLTTYILLAFCFFGLQSRAQMPYSVTVRHSPYQPLDGGIVLSGSTGWVEPYYSVPLGFGFRMGDTTIAHFNLASNVTGKGTASDVKTTGFLLTGALLCDRGFSVTTSKSPVRYQVSGMPGNRIFKFEMNNAGFFEEYFNYETNNDSMSLQIWLYEDSGAVEYHFGPSCVTHFAEYFSGPTGLKIGYIKYMGVNDRDFEVMYQLRGNVSAPQIDSTTKTYAGEGLSEMPVPGTVYRFSQKAMTATNFHDIVHEKRMTVFPATFSESVDIFNPLAEETKYELLSSNGVSVSKGTLQKGGNRISAAALAEGMYILVVNAPSGTEMHKLVKR